MIHKLYADAYEILDSRSLIHLFASKGLPVKPFTSEVDWSKCKRLTTWCDHDHGIHLTWEEV